MNAVRQDRLAAESDTIFALAACEVFEDGMENRTSRTLRRFVERYSDVGVKHLAARLLAESTNQAVAPGIVRMLGWIEHRPSHDDRVLIAERLLHSDWPVARDAAAVALSDLADERSVPALQRAINAESIPTLRADMVDSLRELNRAIEAARA